tara:strand:+ start:1038 stop:1259 length:222 start_codon:yes stop_codon:yes gene_type:complete
MSKLVTDSRFPNPDAAYQAIVDAHRGLSDAESADLNTRLLLVLANHVGDLEVLEEAIGVARAALVARAGTPST